ncbi:hypothetical protein GGS23DRAFT_610823 [Durotheca rogersii]|uniref:uncharacterized protein n=1 Tax=Durotheca rogersii TaxID=419775 RepID=UPI0022212692|nr:uncharacterized protein GGS23DRAFT_610823 [Durotheca rogersii]KAI5862159.1 hypothetical protein GGS23DRAFT_610823 [Durotheca rogersii]
MDALRRALRHPAEAKQKREGARHDARKRQISRPLESLPGGRPDHQAAAFRDHSNHSSSSSSSSDSGRGRLTPPHQRPVATARRPPFAPQAQARDATLATLDPGRPEGLAQLVRERDRAARQVARGPRTRAAGEVQRVLREPSARSVEALHRARRRASLEARWGEAPAALAFVVAERDVAGTRVPSLQLVSLDTVAPPHVSLVAPAPVDCSGLGIDEADEEEGEGEDGGDDDDDDGRPRSLDVAAEEEWEVREAKVMKMTKLPAAHVRLPRQASPIQRPAAPTPAGSRRPR